MAKQYTLRNWSMYSDKPAPVFNSKKEAEKVASSMRTMRGWVEVIEMEDTNG